MPLTNFFFIAGCIFATTAGCNNFVFPEKNETTKYLFNLSLGFAGLSIISFLF